MAVTELKPFHVIEWVDRHPDWSPTFRRGAIIGLQRPFNWAADLGYIDSSPIKRVPKPAPQRRENPMTPEDFALLISKVKPSDPFHDLLTFAWHSGCRPQEARHIEPRHVHLASECVIFGKEEAKGKKRPRIIMLHGPALEIVTRLMAKRTPGKLFLNKRGKPWKNYAVCNRMARLAKKTGRKLALYDARHGFTQKLLESGANHMAVAEILGHSNGQMVSTTYSHMNKATEHLKEALRKASGDDAAQP
jgi:integrase